MARSQTGVIAVRLCITLLALLKERADSEGLLLSHFVRQLIVDELFGYSSIGSGAQDPLTTGDCGPDHVEN